MIDDEIREQLHAQLSELLVEHRDLDDVIARLSESAASNQLQLVRLKKRKLILKDEIKRLQDILIPDIIA